MAINFPDSPSVNDTHTVGDRTWVWDGTVWSVVVGSIPTTITELTINDDLTVDTSTLHVDSANNRVGVGTASPSDPLHVVGDVTVEVTDDGSAAQPEITLHRGSASPADADYLGQFKFAGKNDADQTVNYAKITGKIDDATDTTEDGLIEIANIKAGSQSIGYRFTSTDLKLINGRGIHVDGDVGIGTTSPAEELHILKDQDGDLTQVLIENLDQRLRIGAHYEAGVNQYSKIQSVNDSGSQGERLALNPEGGNVGIGTTSPETPLNIVTANKLGATFTGTTDGEGVRVDQSNYTSGNYVSLIESSYQDTQTAPHVRIAAQFTGSGSLLHFGTSNDYSAGVNNQAMTIDRLGNVGIGTTSPPGHLQVASQNRAVSVLDSGTNNFAELGFTSLGGDSPAFGHLSGYDIHLRTGTSRGGLDTRLFVKRDGLVGIGTTSPAEKLSVAGDVLILDTNPTLNIKDSDSTGASNGSLVFRDSADTVLGRIQMNGNDDLGIQAVGAASTMFLYAYGNWRMSLVSSGLRPYVDNSFDLGATSKRYDDVYATNGTIQTSDERDKIDVANIDYGLNFINSLRPVTYRWDDRSGYTGTRTHMGFIAQEVSTALGDDAATRAVWVDSPVEEYKNADTGEMEPGVERQSLRYEEMIAPMVKAIQELSARVEALEAP